jgi:hypothetical protein
MAHLGELIQYVVQGDDGREFLSRQPRHRAPRLDIGQRVWCTWKPDNAHLFGAGQRDLVLAEPGDSPNE